MIIQNYLKARKKRMNKLIYLLTYPDGFQRRSEVRASIPVDTLNKVMDAWKNLGIKADLEEIK